MVLRSGSYTGNGSSQTISISDLGGTPDFVLIASDNSYSVFVTSSTTSGRTYYVANDTASYVGGITTASNQFSVDTDVTVNTNAKNYYWLAVRIDGTADFKVGSYTGNGGAGHGITGIGFQPDAVIIKRDDTTANVSEGVWSDSTNVGKSTRFDGAGVSSTTDVVSFDADGFTVGTSNSSNTNTKTYWYIAIKTTTNKFKPLGYVGNGAGGHGITGVGFKPDFTMVLDFTSGHNAAARQRDAVGANTSVDIGPNGALTGAITSLDSDGFTLGTNSQGNVNAENYQSLNFLAPAPPSGSNPSFKSLTGAGI